MKRLAFFLVLLSGCMVADQAPAPGPSTDTLESVTEKAHRDWLEKSANLDDQFAKDVRSGKWKAQSQIADAHKAAEIVLKDARNATIGKRKDKDVPPSRTLDLEKTAKSYEEMSAGKRRILK